MVRMSIPLWDYFLTRGFVDFIPSSVYQSILNILTTAFSVHKK